MNDDRKMVKTFCDILQVKGNEAKAAYTGEDTLEIIYAEKLDCVLMDIRMPVSAALIPKSSGSWQGEATKSQQGSYEEPQRIGQKKW